MIGRLHLSPKYVVLVVMIHLCLLSTAVPVFASSSTQENASQAFSSPVIPLPGTCGTGLPPDADNPACCMFGYVFIDGEAVAGAKVRIASPSGSIELWTEYGPDSTLPYYRTSLSHAPLRAQAGTSITIRATHSGKEHTISHTVLAGAQQIDVTIPRRHAAQYTTDLQVWQQAEVGAFQSPSGVAVDRAGRVYTIDRGTARVQVFSASGHFLQQWGSLGSAPGQFANPNGIALDSQGNVYVADSGNNRIQKFSSTGTWLTSWGVEESGGVSTASFWDVAVGPNDEVYVTDTRNHRIQIFSSNGEWLHAWGHEGSEKGELLTPKGIAVDMHSNVYVADTGNNRVQRFSANGAWQASWSTFGQLEMPLQNPLSVRVDQAGNVYVLDSGNNTVHSYTPMGNWLASWGGINTENNQMRNPERFDVAPDGTIYIADTANARVQRFRADGTWLMIVGRRANMLGQLEHPRDVTVDHNNNIYVVDSSNHQVHKFSAEGTWIASWGSKGSGAGQFRAPSGIASDGNSIIYVADTGNNRVQAFRLNGSWLASWGSKGSGTGQFNQPNGIAVDSTGLVYVADTGNHRVQKFHANGTSLKSWGNPGKGPGQFNEPKGIAVDDTGGVYVTDTGNHRVQKWSSDGQLLATWGSKGHNNGTFNYPIGIAVDESYIYVADSTNHRVQKLTKQGAWILSWGALDAEMGYFHKPMGLVVDSIGRVYVADSNNKRIQRFRPMSYTRPIATIVAASSRNVAQGQAVTLVGMGSDSDETSTIAGYGWFLDDEPTPIATTPRATLSTAHLAPGYHTLSFRVRDTEGEEASQTISLEIGHGTPSAETIWTFLLYLDGDNDTAPFLNQNSELGALYRLAHSAPNPSVRVVALYDGPQVGGGDSIRFVIEPDGRLRQEWLGEVDMGDPQTLINFVAWGKQYAPGDAYYLAIADHANALDGIAWDKTTGQNERLTNADIRHALSVITANGADPLDVLHFDGCLMGLMESAYQVRGLTRYLVASENLAWSVFAYEAYRKAIRPTTSAADLAIGIVDQYAERVGSANIPFTIAAIDMNLVDQAVRKIDVLAKGLIRYSLASTANSAVLEDLRQATQTLDSNGDLMLTHDDEYIDLDDWAERIQYNISDSTVQQAAKELRSVLAQLILHERHQSQSYRGAWVDLKNARGIGIYYPVQFSARTYQIYIQGELTFVVDTVWDEFLAAGLAALPFDPSEPQPIPVAPLPFETTTPKYHVHLPVLQR